MTHDAQREAVIAEAATWIGTPFRDCARVKGQRGGVDCGQFLHAVFQNASVVDHLDEPPRYNLQFMMNSIEELYLAELSKYCLELPKVQTERADVFMLRWGKTYSHGGILLEPWPGRIIHALNPARGHWGNGIMYGDAKRDGRILAALRKYRDSPPIFFRPKVWC